MFVMTMKRKVTVKAIVRVNVMTIAMMGLYMQNVPWRRGKRRHL